MLKKLENFCRSVLAIIGIYGICYSTKLVESIDVKAFEVQPIVSWLVLLALLFVNMLCLYYIKDYFKN